MLKLILKKLVNFIKIKMKTVFQLQKINSHFIRGPLSVKVLFFPLKYFSLTSMKVVKKKKNYYRKRFLIAYSKQIS